MLVMILCLCCVVFYCWYRYLKAFQDSPKIVPFWKCARILYKDIGLWHKFVYICKLVEERGGVACGWFYVRGLRGLYVLTDPEDSMTALKSCGEKDPLYQFWKEWLGAASFLGSAQVSKLHRKFFNKVLMPSNLEAFMKYFNDHSLRLVQKFSGLVDKGPTDISHALRLFNLELLCDTMLAYDDATSEALEKYLGAVSVFTRLTIMRFESMFLQHDRIFKWTKAKTDWDKALEVLHQTSNQIIKQRRKQLKEIKENNHKPSGYEVLLDVLMEAVDQGTITEQAMRGEINTIIFAGHDTSAYTLMYVLVLMGSYPHVQERAYEEVQQILGDRTRVTKDDLAKMVYIEAIIKESMRIYPYVVILYRAVKEDVKLKNCTMKTGCTALIFSYGVHRHESWGPDVEEFRPERWLEPDNSSKHRVLLGFSEGIRNCIGRKYAMMSMKTLLVHLVRNFRFKADHTKLAFEYVAVLEPVSGHHIAIEKRI